MPTESKTMILLHIQIALSTVNYLTDDFIYFYIDNPKILN